MGDDQSNRGDLVRWVREYAFYEADDKGNAWPHDPVYEYGLVMEVSYKDNNALIVFGFTAKQLFVVNKGSDAIETISRAPKKLIIPTPEEIEKYEK